MAERGPLPKPYARRRNKRAVTGKHVQVARPVMPAALSKEAKAEWRRVVPELEAMGLLAKVDRGVLIRYCTVWADWCMVDVNLQKTGLLIKGRRDGLVRNPLWLLRSDAEAMLNELAKQLGLSPTARLRAGVVHDVPEAEDDSEEIVAINDYRVRLGAR